jgi:putative sporulation protein YtxC
MEPIKIGTNKDLEKVKEIIDSYSFERKLNIEEENYNNRDIFSFSIGKRKTYDELILYDNLAHVVQDIIIKVYAKYLIVYRVNKICTDFNISDREEIIVYSHNMLMNKKYFVKEKQFLNGEIVNYLIENRTLLVDGYLRFRLKDFNFLIDRAIEKSIEELTAEKEYKEFIKILQYFIDIQEPKYDLVNVILCDNDYKLIDENNKIIENDFFSDIINELSYEGISKDDLLISSLIVIAPKRLVVHIDEKDKDKEIVEVLTNIFKERINFCLGCDACKVKIKMKKGK